MGTKPPNPVCGGLFCRGFPALLVVDGCRREVAFLGPPLPARGALVNRIPNVELAIAAHYETGEYEIPS